ncbi:archaellin/type IV pilin N-terminal domain-containing protein [Nitrosopumilus sp. Nsub]|uniref:archaellin/type IV pilin N-terminal domain-containing protein n=1 Tax=Nitrosopumilus sp. Nsub TaxID=1776294 RepID=UPI000836CD6E|nr:archaellin/type IV pilin N-terminal domain-containing protein [Nitrosopumilus sp. Nsub]
MTKLTKRRGVLGVESAIVMIAFVIVAASLAFVVLNTGFSTTQQAKETIMAGLEESGSSIQLSGSVTGIYTVDDSNGNAKLNALTIPIKIATAGNPINLDEANSQVKVQTNAMSYADILKNTYPGSTMYTSTSALLTAAEGTHFTGNPLAATALNSDTTAGLISFSSNADDDSLLERGENAVLTIVFADGEGPGHNEPIHVEVSGEQGAVLSIDRFIPSLVSGDKYYDLR